eukprot:TRINITY_DN7172_c0_g3_i1.p1 TRINITY_DN7172_c0_g3~~TRINITY_DN7172_c0_g3_i1.p1  ORF type:complete len:355 (+),score=71.14 TRINITY_DN7172_c0_g3_i1:58-1122(+)
MGCCQSRPSTGEGNEFLESQSIDKQIKKEEMKISREIKLLLLGSGESGKSTILKQMKLVYGIGFPREFAVEFRPYVYSNILDCTKALIRGCQTLNIVIKDEQSLTRAQELMEIMTITSDNLTEVMNKVEGLWSDKDIQEAFKRSNEFQLFDSTEYFMSNLHRFKIADFTPSEADILRTRVATSGVTESFFNIDRNVFRIVDVGGQRSERKKWLSCFHDVTCVLFVVAISEFDQVLFEDARTNRIVESLQLFKDICENRWFTNTPIILFLNKKDIFQQKIQSGRDLRIAFPEYDGGSSFEETARYIEKQFLGFNKHPSREIFVKITCATDTDHMRYALNAVKVIIIQKKLETAGF